MRRCASILSVLALCLAATAAFATTKGLNQIVTPDLQPAGQLSLSYQQQDPVIGNPSELQVELGITKQFEFAVFQGFRPNQTLLHAEFGIIQKEPYLLSAGFSNWEVGAGPKSNPQPYLLGGFYEGKHHAMAGAIRVNGHVEGIWGYCYQYTPRLMLATDYQTGADNSMTFGFTYNITPNLSLNPAIYRTNDLHELHPYAVLTWSIQAY